MNRISPRARLSLAAGLLAIAGQRLAAADVCLPLDEKTQSSITGFVRRLAKLPDATTLRLVRSQLAGETCYRIVEFGVAGQPNPLVLFLSPDQRFLFPQVFDTHVDPLQAQSAAVTQTAAKIEAYLATHARPFLGKKDAPVTVAIFADFQCPFCKTTMLAITRDVAASALKDTRIVFLNFPIPSHQWARQAAKMVACLNGNGAFWKVHDLIFEHQSEITAATVASRIAEFARQAQPDGSDEFHTCSASTAAGSTVDDDMAFGSALGVTATPTLFVNGRRTVGAQTVEDLEALISGKER